MPRVAREKIGINFFHIIVQGINKEFIFEHENYKKRYLYLLNEYKEEYNVEILSYCIMDNHAHFLIYIKDNVKMSQLMHKVNTIYAKYYNYINQERVGYVFRDRFLSEPITDFKYLINCINYIHNNPIRAKIVEKHEDYKYSSYNEYMNGNYLKILNRILDMNLDKDIFRKIGDICLFKDIDNSVEDIIELCITRFENSGNFSKNEILKERIIFKILIKNLKVIYKVKYTDIMKYFNLTKGQMARLK